MTLLIRVVGAALAVFLLLGGIQEWRTLGKGLFLPDQPATTMGEEDRASAARTVVEFLQIAAHFYSSSGDRRFAERIPATPEVLEEMQRDAAYVAHNGRVQEATLARIEVVAVTAVGDDRVEVRTREFWTTRWIFRADGRVDGVRSDVVRVRYRLVRDGSVWRVVQWDPEENQS